MAVRNSRSRGGQSVSTVKEGTLESWEDDLVYEILDEPDSGHDTTYLRIIRQDNDLYYEFEFTDLQTTEHGAQNTETMEGRLPEDSEIYQKLEHRLDGYSVGEPDPRRASERVADCFWPVTYVLEGIQTHIE